MPEQKKIQKTSTEKKQEVEEVQTTAGIDVEKLKEELDELLDEIDEVLEVNAEEFVKGYIQKGGQ